MFYKEFNDLKIRALVAIGVLLVFLIGFIVMRPFTVDLMKDLSEQLEELPEFMQKIIGGTNSMANLDNDEYYSLSQWQGKNLGQFIPFIVLILTFPIFAKEYDKKTIYFLLSRKNRKTVFWGKYIAGLIVVLGIIAVMSILGPIVMNIAGYSVGFGKSFMVLFQEIIGVFFFYNIFSFFSVISRDQVKPVVAGILICVGLPMLSMFEATRFLNPYPYILGSSIVNGNGIDWIYSVGIMLASIVLLVANYMLFKVKEL